MSAELLQRQHETIVELRELVSDLLLLLNRYEGLPLPAKRPAPARKVCHCGAGVVPLVRRDKHVNLCACGKAISPRAANCVACNAKAMVVVRLCACGNKRRADSEMCRACYTAAVKPSRAKRHDLCACGVRKRRESASCAACHRRSLKVERAGASGIRSEYERES